MPPTKYRFMSLQDFLISNELNVDGQLDDGWGAMFPVKGREIEATVLFSDISGFSARSLDLSPTETLVFVNNFFAWITAEAVRGGNGIVDKYIGDEMMVVFSKEFGSDDPFVEALQTARWMSEHDALDFNPHVGIASGPVTVGYVGTPAKYDCSAFGAPVALAARCSVVNPSIQDNLSFSTSIVFPATEWGDRNFETVFPPMKYRHPDGTTHEQPHCWQIFEPRSVEMKNIGTVQVREIINRAMHFPSQSAEDRAKEALRVLRRAGRYWPMART